MPASTKARPRSGATTFITALMRTFPSEETRAREIWASASILPRSAGRSISVSFPGRSSGQTQRMDDRVPNTVVVVGASAGGVEALKTVAAGLPPELPAAVAVVLHVSPRVESRLPQILSRAGP